MSQDPNRNGIPDSVEYQPLPNIYQAVAAGASPFAIVTEIVDNSIDFVRRQALDGAKYPNTLEFTVMLTHERIIFIDNAGGLSPDELDRLFRLGQTEAPPEGIGRFGVGAKRLIGLGDRIKYESHATGYQIGAGFEVAVDELESDGSPEGANLEETYQSDVYQVEDLDEGTTRIIVEGLNEGVWNTLIGRDEEGEIERDASGSLWRLGETYEHFLTDGIHIGPSSTSKSTHIDFELTWKDTSRDREISVTAPDPIEFSYVPFDGLHPRRYKQIPFANTDLTPDEDPLRADITVGLMPQSDPGNAGLTLTMNDRNVLFRDTANDLFSTRYLGKFRASAGHGRLYCVVELYGSPEKMPWADTKDSLDTTEEVTDHLLNITENALSEYRRQNYESFPDWMLLPYAKSNLDDFDTGVRGPVQRNIDKKDVEVIDKSNSKVNNPRFNIKPGESRSDKYYRSYPERDRLIKTVQLHSELHIRVDDVVPPSARPAYEEYFDREFENNKLIKLSADAAPEIKDYRIPITDTEQIPLIADIEKLAQLHLEEMKGLTQNTQGVPRWLLPRYREERDGGEDSPELDFIEEFDLQVWRSQHSTSEDVREQPDHSHAMTDADETVVSQQSTNTSHPDENDESTSPHSQIETDRNVRQIETISEPSSSETTIPASSESPQTPMGETGSDQGSEAPIADSTYQLSAEQIETLCDPLEIDHDEIDTDALVTALVEALEERDQLRAERDQISDIVNIEALLE